MKKVVRVSNREFSFMLGVEMIIVWDGSHHSVRLRTLTRTAAITVI